MSLLASGISKSFGKKNVLNNVSITCNKGDIIGIFGRNGSGKSTLLKIIFGKINADAITLKVNSKNIQPNQVIPKKLIAYLPQQSFLPKGIKVRDSITLVLSDIETQEKLFYNSKIAAIEKQKIGTLSLGELRYLELLLIGHLKHPFLLLDEPFSMIEPKYISLISSLLIDLKKEKGIIITDHYYNDVLKVTTSNFLLKNGNQIDILSKEDLVLHNYLSK